VDEVHNWGGKNIEEEELLGPREEWGSPQRGPLNGDGKMNLRSRE